MTEIDTAEIRALWSDPLNQAMGGRTVVALCDEIDRLRASLREAERLKEEAGLLYVSAIRDGDIARAKLDTAREKALEEAANLVEENRDWPLTGKTLKLAADIRALASSGGEKGEANG